MNVFAFSGLNSLHKKQDIISDTILKGKKPNLE